MAGGPRHPIPMPAPRRHPSPSHHEHPGKQPLLKPPMSTGAAAPPRTAREGTWGAGDAPQGCCAASPPRAQPPAPAAGAAHSPAGAPDHPGYSQRKRQALGRYFHPPALSPLHPPPAARAPRAPRVQLSPGAPAAGPGPSHPALDATQLPAGQKALESINIPPSDLIPLSALALAFYLVLIKPSLAPFKSPGRMAPAPARNTGAVGAGAEGAAGPGGQSVCRGLHSPVISKGVLEPEELSSAEQGPGKPGNKSKGVVINICWMMVVRGGVGCVPTPWPKGTLGSL